MEIGEINNQVAKTSKIAVEYAKKIVELSLSYTKFALIIIYFLLNCSATR